MGQTLDPVVEARIVWALRSIARREANLSDDAKRLTEPGLRTWRQLAGRLHEGDLVRLMIENDSVLYPLALRPVNLALSADQGRRLIEESLRAQRHLLTASTAVFLEAAARAFGKPALTPERRAAFGPIRPNEQRILEFPSTAARVAAAVAAPGAPLETYVSYVVDGSDDEFLVGLAMLEFDRRELPTLIRAEALRAGDTSMVTTSYARAASLGGEGDLAALFPPGAIARTIVL